MDSLLQLFTLKNPASAISLSNPRKLSNPRASIRIQKRKIFCLGYRLESHNLAHSTLFCAST